MISAQSAEPLSVLVVDDDSALIRTLADILRLHGYEPSTAGTGREGLAIAERRPPALAVVDLRLPDMDGTELVSKLHELSEMTQVVVLTGNASVESAVAALRERSVDYLLKPVNVEQLLQVASLATERWQRRQAEEKLRESDERFRKVVQSDLLGIMFWNEDGIYDANDAFLKMVEYTHDDLEHGLLTLDRLTPPEFDALDAAKQREISERGVLPTYEKELFTKHGGRVPVLIGAATLDGQPRSGVTFVLDNTDHKAAERALHARAKQQAAVAGFGQRALVAGDIASLFDDAAALVAETLEIPLCSVFERRADGASLVLRAGVGWHADEIGHVVAGAREPTRARFSPAQSRPAVSERDADWSLVDAPFLREKGVASGITVIIPGAVTSFGVLAAHDRRERAFTRDDVHFLQAIAHVLGTAVDRNRTDSAFRQTQRLEAVGRLASGVSHDFNNMLTAITGFAEMIRSGLPAEDPMRFDVDEILKAAGRAAALTRQLLAFSRQQVMETRVVKLNDIVVQMEKMLQPLLGPEVKLSRDLAADLGLVKADPTKIEQVILNLCVNARDAMPEGGTLTIETANADPDMVHSREWSVNGPASYVMLAVSDTGTGMDLETQARVFEPFFSTKAADKGTGLGLATVYGIVKQSGGEIWLYSEPGFGTTFTIYLPRVDSDTERAQQPVSSIAAGSSGATILFADDEDANRRIAQRFLERAGYTVLVAKNGADALDVAAKHEGPIHLLATDIMMPVMNGPDLANALRAKHPELKVVYLSGYSDETVAREGLLAAGERFIEKPFTSETLLRTAREVLDG